MVPCDARSSVLEIGARRGGVSLYFALRGAANVVCSDLHGPEPIAREVHRRHGVEGQIVYLGADATRLPFVDNSFDVVVSKSVLGGIGSHSHRDHVEAALAEVHRVLRPGGWFCFAENLDGTAWHRLSRRVCTSWGRRWYYFELAEFRQLLNQFDDIHFATHGFLGVLGRSEKQRCLLGRLDDMIAPLLPRSQHYLVYGVARCP
jgi:ubiquinone/menaquinone biosynthesis C-methylase UbiE